MPLLAAAQIGYEYQDLVGACLLALGLVQGLDALSTEVPRGDDTAFDDIETDRSGRRVRWQLKHSAQPTRRLTALDLKPAGTLSFLRMTRAAREVPPTADEYRVLLTWLEPDDEEVSRLLVPAPDAPSAFPDWPTQRFRLDPSIVWPAAGRPASFLGIEESVSRADVFTLCARTVVEFRAFGMSRQLATPGPAENWLIRFLAERVGLGRFPNLMSPEIAADLLWRLANNARPRAGPVGLSAVRQRLNLKTSFGRLEQLSPVEPAHEVRRRAELEQIVGTVASRPITVVTGAPGSGKTWAVEEIDRLAREAGCVPARHYCYLRPDDSQIEARVRGEQMVAQLVASLIEQIPALTTVGAAYAADLERLEEILRANSESVDPDEILLIVDGLDHVGRVRARSRTLANADVDIVEKLASLAIPDHSHLVVLSQPGPHLAPLNHQGEEIQLPRWDDQQLDDLAHRLGLNQAIVDDPGSALPGLARAACVRKAAGSPLYCRYIARSLVNRLAIDGDCDVLAIVDDLPAAGADLAAYYTTLLMQASEATSGARELAFILAVADFALTAGDLREIVGSVQAPTVDRAMSALRPLLSEVGSEDAFRIHHESFQRFVVDSLQAEGIPVKDVVAPLESWLEGRGLFLDARAYRHLLPSLLRSGHEARLLVKVGPSFVAESLANGHSHEAVRANLTIAATAAAAVGDLNSIVLCSELARAAGSAFEDKLYSIEAFGRAFVDAHGADAVAERLIFDGRPTWPKQAGLHLCEACDQAGGVPPWREYLDLPIERDLDDLEASQRDDEFEQPDWLGRLRLADDAVTEAQAILADHRRSGLAPQLVRTLARYLARVGGSTALARFIPTLSAGPDALAGCLEEAAACARAGDGYGVLDAANRGIVHAGPPRWLFEALDYGAAPSLLAQRAGSLEDTIVQASELSSVEFIHDQARVELFTLRLRLLAGVQQDLNPVRAAIQGNSWWNDWLRFCVDEAVLGTDDEGIAALRRVASNAHPFTGKPRAVDLWHIQDEIRRSFERLMRRLPPARWADAFPLLLHLADNTGRAFSATSLLDLCEAVFEVGPGPVSEFAVALILRDIANSDEYDDSAALTLRLARFYSWLGEDDRAREAWLGAASLYTAYGRRKDMTLFDLIESLPTLAALDATGARHRALRMQSYASLVVAHTDGSETRHAPLEWFAKIVEIDPAIAAQSLAHALRWRGGTDDYRLEAAIGLLIQAASETARPEILDALASTVRGSTLVRRRIAERLIAVDRNAGEESVLRLIAASDGDGVRADDAAIAALRSWAGDLGVESDPLGNVPAVNESGDATVGDTSIARRQVDATWMFPASSSLASILRAIRELRHRREGRFDDERFVLAFGMRLVEIATTDQRAAARLLRSFAHSPTWEDAFPLVWLADGLIRFGQPALAAQALVYSWTCARRNWWFRTGGAALSDRVERARTLDSETAETTLASELAYIVETDGRQMGLTQGVVELLASLQGTSAAFRAWDTSAEVVFARLPALGNEPPLFAPENLLDPDLSLDDALTHVLAARLCHPRSMVSLEAISALYRIACSNPYAMGVALDFLLRADTSILTLELAMQIAITSSDVTQIARLNAGALGALARGRSFLLRRQALALLILADLPTPRYRPSAVELPTLIVGDGNLSRAVLSLDWGNRIEKLEDVVLDLRELVVPTFDRLWRSADLNDAREQVRMRSQTDPSRHLPRSDIRLWAEEVFETAFQDVLAAQIRSEGEEASAAHRETLPPVRIMSAWAGSRTTRPSDRPGPGADVLRVSGGRYGGWWRLAWQEEELIPAEPFGYGIPKRRTAIGAVVFSNRPLPEGVLPLGAASSADWWAAGTHSGTWPGVISPGAPLIGLVVERDPCGLRQFFMLPKPIAASLSLTADEGRRLALLDKDGLEAVRVRRWWVRPFGDEGSKAWVPRMQGFDLVARDDVWRTISELAIEAPRWVQMESTEESVSE